MKTGDWLTTKTIPTATRALRTAVATRIGLPSHHGCVAIECGASRSPVTATSRENSVAAARTLNPDLTSASRRRARPSSHVTARTEISASWSAMDTLNHGGTSLAVTSTTSGFLCTAQETRLSLRVSASGSKTIRPGHTQRTPPPRRPLISAPTRNRSPACARAISSASAGICSRVSQTSRRTHPPRGPAIAVLSQSARSVNPNGDDHVATTAVALEARRVMRHF
jgi:hypothetical protein